MKFFSGEFPPFLRDNAMAASRSTVADRAASSPRTAVAPRRRHHRQRRSVRSRCGILAGDQPLGRGSGAFGGRAQDRSRQAQCGDPRGQSGQQCAVRLVFDKDTRSTGICSWDYLGSLGRNRERNWQGYLGELAAEGISRDLPKKPVDIKRRPVFAARTNCWRSRTELRTPSDEAVLLHTQSSSCARK